MTASIIDSTVCGSTCQRPGTRARGLAARCRLRPYSRGKRVPSRPWAHLVRWPAAEKQGAAQLFPFPFPFPCPLLFVFPFPFPFPFPLLFVFPFAFPFPLFPLALLLATLVGTVGVFAPLVAGLSLWPEIFPVSPVLGAG
jgi:hypothetical protein